MKRNLVWSLLTALVLIPCQAGSLQEDARAAGFDWLIGEWGDRDTQGAALKISYEWRLDGHAVVFKLVTPALKSEGLINRTGQSEEVRYVAADNQGGNGIGTVSVEDGKIVFKADYRDGHSNRGKVSFSHEKKDEKAVKVTIKLEGDLSHGGGSGPYVIDLVKLP